MAIQQPPTTDNREELRADAEALRAPARRAPDGGPRPTNAPPAPVPRAEWVGYKRDSRNNLERGPDGQPVEVGRWPIYNFMDLAMEDALSVLSLDGMTGASAQQQLEAVRAQVLLMCPTMPAEVVARLSPNEMLEIGRLSLAQPGGDTANPPGPGAQG